MKHYLVQLLIVGLTLNFLTGCVSQPKISEQNLIDPALPSVSINGFLVDMNAVAFEWKEIKNEKVKGIIVYRSAKDSRNGKLERLTVINDSYVTHFVDDKVSPDERYKYRFATFSAEGLQSKSSKTVVVTSAPVFHSVSFFKTIGNLPRATKMIWRPHTNARVKGYQIERHNDKKDTWEKVVFIKGRLNSEYIERKLEDNAIYMYRLRAVTYDGIYSLPSEIAKVVTKPLPKLIQNTKASIGLASKIVITWNSNTQSDIAYYKIYRASSLDGHYKYHVKTKKTKYSDKISKDGKTYFYKITAVDKDGLEGILPETGVKGANLIRPRAPTNLKVTIKNNSAILTWKNNDRRTTTTVLVKTIQKSWVDKDESEIKNIKATKYTDLDIQSGIEYQYKVISVDEHGLRSDPSESITTSFTAH